MFDFGLGNSKKSPLHAIHQNMYMMQMTRSYVLISKMCSEGGGKMSPTSVHSCTLDVTAH